MRDNYSRTKFVNALAAASYDADTTPVAIDRQGFESLVYEISVGVGGITFSSTNKIEFVMTHSDDGSAYTNVTDADVQGVTGISSGIVKSLTAAHASADVTKIGYIGNKRYTKIKADFSGTHGTPTPLCVNAVLGHPNIAPVS